MSRGKQCFPTAAIWSFLRGLWTWPPWVICGPAFNHKLKKFCIYRGFSEILFLKKPHKRTEEIRIGQWKDYFMEHCGSGTPRPANKFKMADQRMKFQETQKLLDVTHHCSVLVFHLQKLLCWKFRTFLSRNKALVYFIYFSPTLDTSKTCKRRANIKPRVGALSLYKIIYSSPWLFSCLI